MSRSSSRGTPARRCRSCLSVRLACSGRGAAPVLEVEHFEGPQHIANAAAEHAREAGVEAIPHAAHGDVVTCIADAAVTLKADLLVVGSRGLGSLQGAVLGSVSHALVHRSSVPVTVVRHAPVHVAAEAVRSPDEHPRIPSDPALLRPLRRSSPRDRDGRRRCSLDDVRWCCYVWSPIPPVDRRLRRGRYRFRPYDDSELQAAAQEIADEGATPRGRLRASTPAPTPRPRRSTAPRTRSSRLPISSDAGLIVLGARGLSTFESMLLGSVSHAVVQHAHRPVLVVPPPRTSRTPCFRPSRGTRAPQSPGSSRHLRAVERSARPPVTVSAIPGTTTNAVSSTSCAPPSQPSVTVSTRPQSSSTAPMVAAAAAA